MKSLISKAPKYSCLVNLYGLSEKGVCVGGLLLFLTLVLPSEGDWSGVWSSSAAAGAVQWVHGKALGNLSTARIAARREANIRATLVNCSRKLVGGRGKRSREVERPFSTALIQWKLMTGSY